MEFTITIADRGTRKQLTGTIRYYKGLQKVSGETTVYPGGVTVDIPVDVTQIEVSSIGYHDYITRVDTLFGTTEIQLEKKPSLIGYIMVGAAIGFFGSRLIKN